MGIEIKGDNNGIAVEGELKIGQLNMEFGKGVKSAERVILQDIEDVEVVPESDENKQVIPMIDENAEANLREDNEIFVTTLPNDKAISLYRLKGFVDQSFIPRLQHKHNWVALWQILKSNKIIISTKSDINCFSHQMNKESWYAGIESQITCSADGMRYYAGIDHYAYEEWDNVLRKTYNNNKTNESGLLEIKKLYKQLEKEFEIEAIFDN